MIIAAIALIVVIVFLAMAVIFVATKGKWEL
jgi:hypothetical protein